MNRIDLKENDFVEMWEAIMTIEKEIISKQPDRIVIESSVNEIKIKIQLAIGPMETH